MKKIMLQLDFESKKTYIQPSTMVICLQQKQQLLELSSVSTTSTSSDVSFDYDKDGGDAGDAW